MATSVELPDELVHDARQCADGANRSVASQIEWWAQLGRAVELLTCPEAAADPAEAARLSECLRSADSETGRQRVLAYLRTLPFPHYEPALKTPGMMIRIEADGTRTPGKFVNREFKTDSEWTSPSSTSGQ